MPKDNMVHLFTDEDNVVKRNEWREISFRARKKIGIYGSEKVVKDLAYFFKEYYPRPCSSEEQQLLDDIAVFKSMREDILGSDDVTEAELITLIFMCDID